MIRQFTLWALLVLMLPLHIHASHIAGGNVSYRHLGGDSYEVSLYVFQDCYDDYVNPTENVRIVPSCLTTFSTFNMPLIQIEEVTQAAELDLPNTACNGGPLPGVIRLTYRDTTEISYECASVELFWKKCNRADANNIDNSDNPCFFISTEMRPAFAANSSPNVSNPTIPYVCGNLGADVNLGAVDPDGDVLRYSFTPALMPLNANNETIVPYNEGYSATLPIPGISIDEWSGTITLPETDIGYYVVAVRIEEYTQDGLLKGGMTVDLQFVVSTCSSAPPELELPGVEILSGTNLGVVDSMAIGLCASTNFCLRTSFASPDSDQELSASVYFPPALNGMSYSTSGENPITVELCGNNISVENSELIVISLSTDDYPIPSTSSYGLLISPGSQSPVNAGVDYATCSSLVNLSDTVVGASWSGSEIVNQWPSEGNTEIALPGEGTYTLVYSTLCQADSLTITVNETPTLFASEDIAICENQTLLLQAELTHDEAEWRLLDADSLNPGLTLIGPGEVLVEGLEQGLYTFGYGLHDGDCIHVDSTTVQIGISSPVILQDGTMLSVSAPNPGSIYTWYLDGQQVSMDGNAHYTPSPGESGQFTVEELNPNGCEAESDSFWFQASSLEELSTQIEIQIRSESLLFMNDTGESMVLRLADVLGRPLMEFETNESTGEVPMNLKAGGYLLTWFVGNQTNSRFVLIE